MAEAEEREPGVYVDPDRREVIFKFSDDSPSPAHYQHFLVSIRDSCSEVRTFFLPDNLGGMLYCVYEMPEEEMLRKRFDDHFVANENNVASIVKHEGVSREEARNRLARFCLPADQVEEYVPAMMEALSERRLRTRIEETLEVIVAEVELPLREKCNRVPGRIIRVPFGDRTRILTCKGGEVENRPMKKRGGDRRKGKDSLGGKKRLFAQKVDAIKPLWDFIIDHFESNSYDGGCVRMLKASDRFAELASGQPQIPDALLREVFQRKDHHDRKEKIPDRLSAQAFALRHAARDMESRSDNYETLRKHYLAGKK